MREIELQSLSKQLPKWCNHIMKCVILHNNLRHFTQ